MCKKQKFSFLYSSNSLKSFIIALLPFSVSAYSSDCKIPKSYYKHVSCTPDSRYFLAVTDNGKSVALLDETGKKSADLINYQQVLIDELHDGLFPVVRNDKLGYLNIKGVIALPFEYDVLDGINWARGFRNSRVIVRKNNDWGVVDTRNRIVVPFSSDIVAISDYESGKATITMTNKSFMVDVRGKKIQIPNQKSKPDKQMSNSKKTQSERIPKINSDKVAVKASQKTKLVSTQEVSLPENRINHLLHTYQLLPSHKRAEELQTMVQNKLNRSDISQMHKQSQKKLSDNVVKLFPKRKNGKWGFVDINKTTMITYSFDEVTPFSSGLAGVRMGDDWGFIDKAGNLVIDFRFYKEGVINNKNDNYHGMPAFMFYDDYAWIGNLSDGSKLCVNKSGKTAKCK